MALDLQGLFVNPADIRNERLAGLAQQRRQLAQMGGSMSGLLGQVAGGGSVLGEQLAEGIAGGLGLKTAREVEAEKNQAVMRDVMSGNLNKMKRLRENLAGRKDVDPRVLTVLNDRINTAEDRVRSLIDRTTQQERQRQQDERDAQRFGMTVEEFNRKKTDRAEATKKEQAAITAAVNTLNKNGFESISEIVDAGIYTPKQGIDAMIEARKSKINAESVGPYTTQDGTEIIGSVDPDTGFAYQLTSGGWKRIPGEGLTKGKPPAEAGDTSSAVGGTASEMRNRLNNPAVLEQITNIAGADTSWFSWTGADMEMAPGATNVIADNASRIYKEAKGNLTVDQALLQAAKEYRPGLTATDAGGSADEFADTRITQKKTP